MNEEQRQQRKTAVISKRTLYTTDALKELSEAQCFLLASVF